MILGNGQLRFVALIQREAHLNSRRALPTETARIHAAQETGTGRSLCDEWVGGKKMTYVALGPLKLSDSMLKPGEHSHRMSECG